MGPLLVQPLRAGYIGLCAWGRPPGPKLSPHGPERPRMGQNGAERLRRAQNGAEWFRKKPEGPLGPPGARRAPWLNCFEHMVQTSRHISDAFWNAFECNVSATPFGPRLPSVESGPRLPSEKSGLVAAAVVAAAAMVAAPPAGAMATAEGMAARARLRRARAAIACLLYTSPSPRD